MYRVVIVLLVGLTLARTAAADAPPIARLKVAVVPGIAINLDAARVDALGQDLADALTTELDLDAIGGLEVRRRLPPDGVAPDCVTVPSCVRDVAARLGASQLLFVVMVDTGSAGAIQIDSTWIDAGTGHSASRPPIDITAVADARTRFAAAAHQLLPDAPLRAKATQIRTSVPTLGEATPRHLTTLSIATGGVAVVGLGLGIGVGLSARAHYNDCLALAAGCDQAQKDSIRHRDLLADGGFFLAAAGAIATGLLFATSGREAQLVMAPSPEGVSV